MKKQLLFLVILISIVGLYGCGEAKIDADIDKTVSMSCIIYKEKKESIEPSKVEEMQKIGKRLEEKYKGKEEEFSKIRKDSFLKQCPDIYKEMVANKAIKE